MGMGFAPTWLRQESPPPASQNHFNHWVQLLRGETPEFTAHDMCPPNSLGAQSGWLPHLVSGAATSLVVSDRPV